MDNTLYIIRGLPGSGKSTEALRLIAENPEKFHWYEADMFFINEKTKEYQFDPSLLGQAHKWCQFKTEESLKLGFNVIVSNTFSTEWEFKPYKLLANKYKIPLNIRQMNNKFASIHNVPESSIIKMQNRWEEFEGCIQIPPVEN